MTVSWFTRPLGIGDEGDDVALVQRKLHCYASCEYDDETASRVRGLQRAWSLPVTGEVDAATAEVLGEHSRFGLAPDWYHRELELGSEGEDVSRLADLLGASGATFTAETEALVRRFQSAHHLPLTGRITESDALVVGDVLRWTQ